MQGNTDLPAEIARVHLRNGQREVLLSLIPPDPAGTIDILRVVMTPDARAYAYRWARATLSSLYLLEGLRCMRHGVAAD